MTDKFLKDLIYIILASLLVIFLLIQPYNFYCRISDKCRPVLLSALLWHPKGEKQLTINFAAETADNLQGKIIFHPKSQFLKIRNGKNISNLYIVKNLTDHEITIRAKYDIDPAIADKYLERIECLCFQNQILPPQKSLELPVDFRVDQSIEKDPLLKNLQKIIINYKAEIATS